MSFASRWVVLRTHDVGPDDLDAAGLLHADVVDGWLADARAAYLEKCTAFCDLRERSGAELQARIDPAPDPRRFGTPTGVVVGAGATEIYSTAFRMALRLRPVDGDGDDAINVKCEVSLVDLATGEALELGNDIRDELIALEHAAAHIN